MKHGSHPVLHRLKTYSSAWKSSPTQINHILKTIKSINDEKIHADFQPSPYLHLGGVISAFAEDFKPVSGVKYLIKCKKNANFAIYNSTCYKGENDNTVILSHWTETDDRSEFTIEYVSESDAYYIKSATAENVYTYAINTDNANSNVGIKAFDTPDETCLWAISYQASTNGFVIKPKNGSNGWNCRGSYGGNNHIGQWTNNGTDDNTWYFIPSGLTSGYYILKSCATDRPSYYFNDFTYASNTDGVTMGAQTLPSQLPNGYIWHVVNNKGVLTVTNGQGGEAIKTDNGTTTSNLTVMAYTNGGYFFDSYLNAGKGRPVGDYQKLTTWKDGGMTAADNLWNFNTIENLDESHIYNVVINNVAGYVKLTATNEAAKNGGFFYLSAAPQASDFTAADVEYMKSSITVEGNTITVNYSVKPDGLNAKAVIAETEVLAKTGVGYPAPSSEEYAALSQAIANAKAATDDNVDALNAALDAAILAYKTTENIQMPEDGHTYVFTNVHLSQERKYLNYTDDGLTLASRGTSSAEELPQSAKFTCHVINGRYAFVNNSGKYLIWKGKDKGANGQKGYMDAYDATECNLQVVKITKKDYVKNTVAAEDLFGYVTVAGNDPSTGKASSFIITAGSGFNQDDQGLKHYYQDSHSTAFSLEEVTYPNLISFNSTEGAVTGADYVATFSAPFATLLPEGVKAYYGKKSDDGTKVVLTEVEGEAVPANQGVILTSTAGTKVYMVPAAGETPAAIESNALGHSAGAAKDLEAGKAYILGKGSKGVAFYKSAAGTLPMNRAYLKNESDVNVSSIQMVFGETVDGIEDAVVMEGKDAPIYDLTGRRVLKAVKGGVYIQNGQKFIVK